MDRFWIILIIIALFILSIEVPKLLKEKITVKLTRYCIECNFTDFDKLIESRLTNLVIDPFNIDFMKLNKAITTKNRKEINHCFEHFENCRLNDKQKETVYYTAFYYYVSVNEGNRAKKYGNLLLNLPNTSEEFKAEIKKYYSVLIEKSYQYLEEDLKTVQHLENPQKAKLEFIISKMYENKGDLERAKEYLNKSLEDLN